MKVRAREVRSRQWDGKCRRRCVPGMLKEQEEGQWGEVQRATGRVLHDEAGRVGAVPITRRFASHRTELGFYVTWDGKSWLALCSEC